MSSGFAGSNTRGMEGFDREVESRLQKKKLDVFTDDFDPPGVSEGGIGQDFRKPAGGYQKKHDDQRPVADVSFVGPNINSKQLQPSGDPRMQPEMDEIDQEEFERQAPIKKPQDQFPGSTLDVLNKLAEGVDEGLWKKAKDASQEAFGKIKWPFVMWWYENHGGK